MAEKPLYVSFENNVYKKSKADMLNSQIDLLNSMKHLHNLRQIKEEKFKAKMRLYSLFSSLVKDIEELDSKMPDVNVPKEKAKKIPVSQSEPFVKKQKDPKQESFDSELRDIQEKLRRLNSA
jgi:hypothetical protein